MLPRSDHRQDRDKSQVEQVGVLHLLLVWCLCFEMILMMIYYWILEEWWNNNEVSTWILDDCQNDYEMLIKFLMNVETMMKMLMFWNDMFEVIYYCVAMNIKLTMRCWLGYYEFGLLTNGCMSITKDLLLYFIECNYDEWLYEYYEGSTVVFYWM